MPNYCYANIIVRGRKDCVDEFYNILCADYSYYKKNKDGTIDYASNEWCTDPENFSHIPHFFRIFDAEEWESNDLSAVYKCSQIDIECAWSVFTCMFPGTWTYYDKFETDHHGNHFGTHILEVSKRLQLEIEIWSKEEGMEFQEHYKICSGILVINETYDIQTYDLSNINYEQYKSTVPEDVKQSIIISYGDINNEEEYECYKDDYDSLAPIYKEEKYSFDTIDAPKYLCNLVMVKEKKDGKY